MKIKFASLVLAIVSLSSAHGQGVTDSELRRQKLKIGFPNGAIEALMLARGVDPVLAKGLAACERFKVPALDGEAHLVQDSRIDGSPIPFNYDAAHSAQCSAIRDKVKASLGQMPAVDEDKAAIEAATAAIKGKK